jgi:hypothetical protein
MRRGGDSLTSGVGRHNPFFAPVAEPLRGRDVERDMKRGTHALTIASALLVLAAVLAVWARGYRARDGVWYSTDATRYGIHNYRGQVLLWRLSVAPTPTAITWVSSAKMGAGLAWDSTPEAWYDQFRSHPMGAIDPAEVFRDAPAGGAAVERGLLGFRHVSNDAWYPRAQLMHGYPAAHSSALYVPMWAIAAAAAAWPAMRVVGAVRASRRRRGGLCVDCGYDLRATPAQCPECGGHAAGAY